MKKLKNISLILFSAFVFVCSAIIFTGCKDKKETARLFVFATEGGYVQINNGEDVVGFGDEGKIFKFKEDEKVSLKAIPHNGYDFVKWEYADDLDERQEDFSIQQQITLVMDEDEIVVRAVFATNGTIVKHNVTYATNAIGYSVVPEDGYSNKVLSGEDFKFKVNLQSEYSNSNIVVKAKGDVLTADGNGIYTISNINEDVNIVVEGVILNATETYTISTNDNRLTIVPTGGNSLSVEAGSSLSFDLSLVEGFKFTDVMVVKANGQILYKSDGVYTISNITSDIEIIVEGIEEIVKYTVTIPLSSDYVLIKTDNSSFPSNSMQIEENEIFEFKVVSTKSVVVKVGESILTANDGIYSIIVNEDIEIVIEDAVQTETYEFNLGFEQGVEDFIGSDIINFPQGFSFTIIQSDSKVERYEASEFIVRTSFGEDISIRELFANINEELAALDLGFDVMSHLAVDGREFISIDDDNIMHINWSLVNLNSAVDVTIVL